MRIDVISIFPAYLEPLGLSLLGRARGAGLVELHAHDLRSWTDDRHHTVDDAPFGGGAGMVMKPGPWGEAIDVVRAAGPPRTARLVVPTPAGEVFTQSMAERLALEPWLIFACGRYEGIDQRVVDHYRDRMPVSEVSIGDYVLNGGEAAAMVVVEAVTRLLPGFVGNPESVVEESYAAGGAGVLLEHPVYTRPVSWRGREVPDVLLSGDHGAIARWRHEQAVRRTALRRPDLAHVSAVLQHDQLARLLREDPADPDPGNPGEAAETSFAAGHAGPAVSLELATGGDVAELFVLQRCCWVTEAQHNDALDIPPLVETLSDARAALGQWQTYVVRVGGRLVASVRGRRDGDRWLIGRLMVAPDLQGRGLGRWLLDFVESVAPPATTSLELFTGSASLSNQRLYRRAGYRRDERRGASVGVVVMTKPRVVAPRSI